MKRMYGLFVAAFALLLSVNAYAQNSSSAANHAFAIGKGANVAGFTSLLCGSAQLAVGQAAANPICRTVSGDLTLDVAGVATLATVNANVGSFGSATQCVSFTTNAKGQITAASAVACTPAISSITGLGAGCATWLATPSSANLRGCLTDEVGTGAAYFIGGALGTPASVTLTNGTGLVPSTGLSTTGTPSNLTFLRGDNSWQTVAGTGDVVGPASATDNAVARFDGVTGKLIQNSAVTIADTTGDIVTPGNVSAITVSGSQVATQANQETGSATNLVVTPGRQQYHPSAVKAWGAVANGGAASLTSGYNVASVSRTALGIVTVTFTTAFSASNVYACTATAVGAGVVASASITSASVVTITTYYTIGAANIDNGFMVSCFGDQP